MRKDVKAWFQNKDLFCKELMKGYLWQLYVAEKFRRLGCDVSVPDLEPYEGWRKAPKFINTEDLIANGHIIEVKSRNYEFSSHRDFPFDTIAVDTKKSFDGKTDKPLIYVTVSQKGGGLAALDVEKTRKQWVITRRFDSVRRIPVVSYDCHRDLWEDLEPIVERLILNKPS